MQEQDQNPSGQEVKREIPNQHLADRIAGKVDEQGKELSETKTETSKVEDGVPNQHLADKIAGKVDHNNVAIDEELGEVPEELPTHLGGIELENETTNETETTTETVNETESTTTNSTEEPTDFKAGEKIDVKEEEIVSPQGEVNVDDGSQKG